MADTFMTLFPVGARDIWRPLGAFTDQIQEIRIRLNKPVIVVKNDGEWFLKKEGLTKESRQAIVIEEPEMNRYLNHFCQDSIYAFQDELKNGFITVPGGHRVGVAGQVMLEQGEVVGMKYITCINIRVTHQIKGVANSIMPLLYEKGKLQNTLIVSPPGCGKTTLLRDMVRQISDGNNWGEGMPVSVIDERSEIAGCYLGIPQNDVGIRTDVLDGCPKEKGMMLMLRSMSPKVVAVDELGGMEDLKSVFHLSFCGCKVIATVHGEDIQQLRYKEGWERILGTGLFGRIVVLGKRSGMPEIIGVYDKEMKRLGEVNAKDMKICFDC
ncbi:MAG: stage III sporulation protein AA [Lachnospiraceae bacterium]|nr:stage III sporulation protein AA [Lachnospiraceae bacterium]